MTTNGEVRTVSSTGGEKGVKPARFDLIPIGPLTKVAELYAKGAEKYADHNWRQGYEWSKSYAALQRHATQFWNGEMNDAETGLPHMTSVIFHAMALLEFAERFPDFDDRFVAPLDEPGALCYELPCTHKSSPAYEIETAAGPMQTLGCEDAEPGVRCFVVPGVHDESCPSYRGSADYLQREVS